MQIGRVLLVLLGVLAIAACDSGGSSDGGPDDAGVNDGGNNDGGGTDGGVDAGTCTTQAPANGPAFVGSIVFTESNLSTGVDYKVSAAFHPDYGGAAIASGCAGTAMGACCFVPHPPASCSTPPQVSAGTITVFDSGSELGALEYSSGYAGLDSLSQPAIRWSDGDTLKAAGGGGSIPNFSGQLVAPTALASVTPAFSGTTTLSIAKGNDFTLRWQPTAGAGSVQLVLEDTALDAITCAAPLTNGSLAVPGALLNQLGSSGTASISTLSALSVIAGNASVTIEALGPAQTAQTRYP